LIAVEAVYVGLDYEGVNFSSDHFHIHGRMKPQPDFADNGTSYLGYESGRGDAITMSLLSGGLFSLLSLDLAEFYSIVVPLRPDAEVLTLLGTTANGAILTHQLFLDGNRADGIGGIEDFEHFLIPNFTDLFSVTFVGTLLSGADGGVSLDNIEYVSVPEPAMLSLLTAGLIGVFASRRRPTKLRSAAPLSRVARR
jgi:hypothetical protein